MTRRAMPRIRGAFWAAGAAIVLVWAGSMWWLFGDPGRDPALTRPTAYAAMVPTQAVSLSYRVMAGRRPAGRLIYEVIPEGSGRRITWRLSLTFQPEAHGAVSGEGETVMDSSGLPSSFFAALRIGAETMEVVGTRNGDVMSIRTSGFGVSHARVMHVDSTLSFGDGFSPGLVGGCPPKSERLRWQAFNPLTLAADDITIERERGKVDPPAPEGGCVAAVTYRGLKTLMWIDAGGVVTRQRSPVGLELVLEPSAEAAPDQG